MFREESAGPTDRQVDRWMWASALGVLLLLQMPLTLRHQRRMHEEYGTRITSSPDILLVTAPIVHDGAVGFIAMIPSALAMKRYIERHLETVRRQGGEGLIAEIVRVEQEGGKISPNEIVAMVFLLLFAGHETTTHLISGSVFELAKNPVLRG